MIRTNLKSLLGISILWTGLISLNAQDEGFISNQLTVPPSPQAAQLGTYGEVPVSLASGTANVSIPLFAIHEGGINIPISLGYQSSGLNVNQRPSWVGMGWNLSAGGVISRSMRGLADESLKGFLNKSVEIPDASLIATDLAITAYRTGVYDRLNAMVENEFDYIPDAFSFNFGGYGGSFFFGNDGLVHSSEHNALQFDYTLDTNGDIISWTVIDDNGFVYLFEATETSQVSISSGSMPEFISAWYLTSIFNPRTHSTALFTYDSNSYEFVDLSTAKTFNYSKNAYGVFNQTSSPLSPTTNRSRNLKFISQIILNDHTVTFNTVSAFNPAIGQNDYRRLTDVTWTNGSSSRTYDFDIDLFPASGSTSEYKRLRLNSVIFEDKEYGFEYFLGNVPKRHDNGQDHWGFYNAATNSSLVPNVTIGGVTYQTDDADRSVDLESTKIGTLSKIIYPTGGETSFSYELNGYKGVTTEDDIRFMVGSEVVEVDGISYSTQNCETRNVDSAAPTGTTHDAEINYKLLQIENDDNMGQNYPTLDVYAYDGATEIFHETISMEEEIIYEGVFTGISGASHYKLELCAIGEVQHARLEYTVNEYDPAGLGQPIERKVGGLRINQIANYDPINDQTEYTSYDYGFGGYLVWDLPKYTRLYSTATGTPRVESGGMSIGSSPTKGLGPSSLISGYEFVTEWKGTPTHNLGRTVHQFFKQEDLGAAHTVQISQNWKRSKPVLQQIYDDEDNLVKQVLYQYSSKVFRSTKAFRCSRAITLSSSPPDYQRDFNYHNFNLETVRFDLTSKLTTDITETNSIVNNQLFEYESDLHVNPTSQTFYDSEGKEVKTIFNYPIDDSTCESNCFEIYAQDKQDCNGEINKHALEAQACQSIWNDCYTDWHECHMDFRQDVSNDCNKLGLYSIPCSNRKNKDYNCNGQFKGCLQANGYESCLSNVSNDFESCQKMAFVNYRVCQEDFTECLSDEYENETDPEIKALELLNVSNVLNIPKETILHVKILNDSSELRRITNQFVALDTARSLPFSAKIIFKGGEDEKTTLTVNEYDTKGNPLEIFDHTQGIYKTYVWGYKSTRIVAQVIGASQWEVDNAGLQSAVLDQPSSDTELRTELAKLYTTSSLSNAHITTYTYDLIDGITSQTDPNERLTKYEYEHGRLKRVIDHDQNVLQDYEYNLVGTE